MTKSKIWEFVKLMFNPLILIMWLPLLFIILFPSKFDNYVHDEN